MIRAVEEVLGKMREKERTGGKIPCEGKSRRGLFGSWSTYKGKGVSTGQRAA